MCWSLATASEDDIDQLMTWLPDSPSVDVWSGPKFRYPFDKRSFHEDCRWREFSSYVLVNKNNKLCAFGQLGSRYGRAHFARLIANPDMRGQGIGKTLLNELTVVVQSEKKYSEIGLFVYQKNAPAYRCYLAAGFSVQDYPDDAPMADKCYYLTRTV